MSKRAPRVSVGLPVYNGDDYVSEAIESILAQSLEDLELIISDNASTDGTEEICREAAARDERVRYVRNDRNLGAAPNYNQTLAMARARYFKWMAHDDVCRPRFIAACVEALDEDPGTILAYPSALDIAPDGAIIGPADRGLEFDGETAVLRFRRAMDVQSHGCLPVFGVMRTDLLRQTGQHGNYPSADRVLLAELALRGRLVEVEEELFLHREHPDRYWNAQTTVQERAAWFDTSRADRRLNQLARSRLLLGHLRGIERAPLSFSDRWRCRLIVGRWAWARRRGFVGDLLAFAGVSADLLSSVGVDVSRFRRRRGG